MKTRAIEPKRGARCRVTEGGRGAPELIPQARGVRVAGAGQVLPWQAPNAVAAAVARFLG